MKLPHALTAILLLSLHPLTAQDEPAAEPALPEGAAAALDPSVLLDPQALKDTYLGPDTLNAALDKFKKINPDGTIPGFLDALNLRFIAFDPEGSNSEAGLGIAYDFERSFTFSGGADDGTTVLIEAEDPIRGSVTFHARGKIAFDQDRNPNDFLDTGIAFHAFQLIEGDYGTGFDPVEYKKLLKAAAAIEGDEAFLKSKEREAMMAAVRPLLTSDFFWDISGHASLESNQDFSQKQIAYGFKGAAIYRIWNPENARCNFFDWPFALTRVATGVDSQFTPSGNAIPSLLIGIDGVDPSDNEGRMKIDPDDSVYPRLRGEVAFKTVAGRTPFSQENLVFSASYRYYKELDASSAIEAAGLDEHGYLAMTLGPNQGPYLSYTTGKLPLGVENEQVLGVGFRFNFN